MALCWILHLTGDLHQPLHTVALFSAEFFPSGDRGGNYIDEWLTRHAGLAARFVCTAELKSQVQQGQANSRPGVVLLSHEYRVAAESLARRQGNLAGYRIRELLR